MAATPGGWSSYGSDRSTGTSNNSALLFLPGGFLADAGQPGQRGHGAGHGDRRPAAAQPNQAVVAGDRRANENIALTAVQNLFARSTTGSWACSTPARRRG